MRDARGIQSHHKPHYRTQSGSTRCHPQENLLLLFIFSVFSRATTSATKVKVLSCRRMLLHGPGPLPPKGRKDEEYRQPVFRKSQVAFVLPTPHRAGNEALLLYLSRPHHNVGTLESSIHADGLPQVHFPPGETSTKEAGGLQSGQGDPRESRIGQQREGPQQQGRLAAALDKQGAWK